MAEYKALPIGIDDFKKIIFNDYYYIDKTLFIQELLDKMGKVNLFMRPRRFGKTLVLSMLRYYFEKEYDFSGNLVDNTYLFDGLNIMRTDKSCMLGMLSQAVNYIVKSNREAGNGRYDIVMKTPSRRGLAMIFELKIATTIDELKKTCQYGLKQIEDKHYVDELYNDGYRNIKRYAIAFYKKDCEVMCNK